MQRGEDQSVALRGPTVRHELKLKEGVNIVKLRAVNAAAAKDQEREEANEQEIRVEYYRERPAPQFTFREVVPLSEGAVPLRVQPGQVVTVSVPKVRLVGQVVGEENLAEVKRDNRALAGFEAGTARQFDFKDEITLKKGEQVVLYQSRSKNSPVGEGKLRLVYQPSTARIGAVRPVDKCSLYEQEVELTVELSPPDHQEPYTLEVTVNGREQAKKLLEASTREFKGRIKLDPGANRIVVRLHNEWKAEANPRELQVSYLRPPRLVEFALPRTVEKAVQDFSAVVESPPELSPCAATINGAVFRGERFTAELLDREKGRWKVTLRDVELKEGDNALLLTVANTDGASRSSLAGNVRFIRPKPPVPLVKFRDFPNEEITYGPPAPKQTLVFSIASTAPLTRVELHGENDAVLFKAKPDDLKSKKPGEALLFSVPVRLRPAKPTTFRVVATNDGGDGKASATLHVPERPAYVVIERLESFKMNGKDFWLPAARNDEHGRALFKAVPEGHVKLRGRIFWNDPNAASFRGKINLRVYANGFLQLPAEAERPKPGQTECAFSANVLLTRASNNLIEITLPDLKLADGQRNACVVQTCANPIQGRRLHLVVIGIDVKNGAALKQRALDAIGAKQAPDVEGKWQAAPTFEEVVAYDPLVGGVSQGQILRRLDAVKRQIQAAAPQEKAIVLGEVVLVFYQGREIITPEGHFLLTDDYKGDKDLAATAVSCADIIELFGDARGVQVLMLDVERVARAKAEADAMQRTRAFEGTRLGVFHSYWSGEKSPASRLLPLLQQGWAKANNLEKLAEQVEGLRRAQAPELRFSPILPGELSQLEFGGKR